MSFEVLGPCLFELEVNRESFGPDQIICVDKPSLICGF